eukprot:1180896-Prorocentrum_minimum.AAC.2
MRGSRFLLLVNIILVSSPEVSSVSWFGTHADDFYKPILASLTLKHKIGQMMQLNIDQFLTPDMSSVDRDKYATLSSNFQLFLYYAAILKIGNICSQRVVAYSRSPKHLHADRYLVWSLCARQPY